MELVKKYNSGGFLGFFSGFITILCFVIVYKLNLKVWDTFTLSSSFTPHTVKGDGHYKRSPDILYVALSWCFMDGWVKLDEL